VRRRRPGREGGKGRIVKGDREVNWDLYGQGKRPCVVGLSLQKPGIVDTEKPQQKTGSPPSYTYRVRAHHRRAA
jgi:hypothetical protein